MELEEAVRTRRTSKAYVPDEVPTREQLARSEAAVRCSS